MRWLVPVAALGLLVPMRHLVLERRPERVEERTAVDYSRLKASGALVTYVGSIFLGSFRVAAIDALWMGYTDAIDEKNYLEAVEYGEAIRVLQPRNPEVYSMLGHDLTMNVPALFRDPEKKWEWIRRGLETLRAGVDANPREIYPCHQMGFWLLHRFERTGEAALQLDLLAKYLADPALRAIVEPDPANAAVERSPFLAAADWFARAREMGIGQWRRGVVVYAQMGSSMHPIHMEHFLVIGYYLDGIWRMQTGEYDEAIASFRRGAEIARSHLSDYPPDLAPAEMLRRRIDFMERMARIVELQRAWELALERQTELGMRGAAGVVPESTALTTPLAHEDLLRAVDALGDRYPGMDEGYLARLGKAVMASYRTLRRAGVAPGPIGLADEFEYNNSPRNVAWLHDEDPEEDSWLVSARAALLPFGIDEDWFGLNATFHRPEEEDEPGFVPRPVRVQIDFTASPAARLHVSLFRLDVRTGERVRLDCFVAPAGERVGREVESPAEGPHYLQIVPADEARSAVDAASYEVHVGFTPR